MHNFLKTLAFSALLISCTSIDTSQQQLSTPIKVISREKRPLIRWAMLIPAGPNRVEIFVCPPFEETRNFLRSIGYEGRMPQNIMGSVYLELDKDGQVTRIEGAITERIGVRPVMSPEPGFAAIGRENRKLSIQIVERLYAMGVL